VKLIFFDLLQIVFKLMIAFVFQFLGCTEVDQPKGIEVVKEGIRKLKFSQQIKKAEGSKTPKVSAGPDI
jgi:hypothetical protein